MDIAIELPFANCSDYQIITEFSSSKTKVLEFLSNNKFSKEMFQHINKVTKDNYTCKYYNEDSFSSAFGQHSDSQLRIFHTNIRSLKAHCYQLHNYLDILKCNFDVILLSELGKPNIGLIEKIFSEYKLFYNASTISKGGAGALVRKESFDSIEILEGEEYNLIKKCDCSKCIFENIWLNLTNNGNKFIVGCVYQHPDGNIGHFIDSFSHIVNNVNDKLWYVWAGDINIDCLKINDPNVKKYIDQFIENNFFPCITLPTRITDNSATLIDHVMVRVPRKLIQTKVSSGNLINDITDHLSQFTLINTKLSKIRERPFVRLFTNRNIAKFQSSIKNDQPLLNNIEINDCNEHFSKLIEESTKLLNKGFPLTKLSRSKAKDKPFISSAIKVSIKHKHKLYNRYLNNRSEMNKIAWSRYSNRLKIVVKEAETQYIHKKIDEHTDDSKTMWQVLGNIINNKSKSISPIHNLMINNQKISNQQNIAEEFNKYFCSIGSQLANNFDGDGDIRNFLGQGSINSIQLFDTSEVEVQNEINDLDTKKSVGHDNLSPKFIQLISPLIIKPLSEFFNKCFENGEYFDFLKGYSHSQKSLKI